MRTLNHALAGAAIIAAGACGSTLPDADSLVVDVKVASAVTGGALPFTFTNASSGTVTTGALDCVVTYEHRVAGDWIPVAPLRSCIAIAEIHPAGSSRGYETVAPDHEGTWRLVVEAWSGGSTVMTWSQSFEVLGEN